MKTVQGQIFCNTTKLVGKRPDVFYFDNRTMQKVDENLCNCDCNVDCDAITTKKMTPL